MSDLLANDIDLIHAQNSETLADWWCKLNRWEWPLEIQNEEKKPINFSDPTPRRDALMREIEKLVSDKFISWWWNKDRMTKAEHDEWYKKTSKL